MKWYLILGIINLCISIYITILMYLFWGANEWHIECVKTLNIWLLVYLILEGLHLIRSAIVIVIWLRARDPSLAQIKVELFYGVWIYAVEFGWLIYGNTFIYTDEFEHCQHRFWGHSTGMEVKSVLVLVIYGYILFAVVFFGLIFAIFAFIGYK